MLKTKFLIPLLLFLVFLGVITYFAVDSSKESEEQNESISEPRPATPKPLSKPQYLFQSSQLTGNPPDSQRLPSPTPTPSVSPSVQGDRDTRENPIQFYREALDRHPDDPKIKSELAYAYLEDNQAEQAKQFFEDLLAKNPNDPEGHLGLGVIDRLNGNYDSALARINTALQLDPDNLDAKYNAAEILTYEKKSDGNPSDRYLAEKYYNDLLQKTPEDPDAANGLASVYLLTGRTDEAISSWEKLASQLPEESNLQSNLSEAYVAANRFDDAIATSQKALATDPLNSDAYFFLGKAQVAKGNTAAARESVKKALQIDPDNSDYQKLLEQLGPQ